MSNLDDPPIDVPLIAGGAPATAAALADRQPRPGRPTASKPGRPSQPPLGDGFHERPSAPPELLPALVGATAHQFRYSTFVRERDVRGIGIGYDTSCAGAPHLGKRFDPLGGVFIDNPCPVLHLGYLAGHRQRWISAGTALGEIVYSLSLAPGESRSVAMIDLRRRQQGKRQEATDATERLISDQDHTFALQEVAAAVALEHQHGKTAVQANTLVTGGAFVAAGALVGGIGGALIGTAVEPGGGTLIGAGVGAGAGAAAGGLVFAGAQAIGMIEAESSGNRDVMGETNQRIAQATSQQSALIRSLWSTVVTEDVQEEQFGVRTSNVTNYNHMHALNMEYFEVLHRYDTLTTVERVVPILYLPFTALPLDDGELVDEFWDSIRLGLPQDLRDKGDAVFVEPPPPEFVPQAVPEVPDDVPHATLNPVEIEVVVEWDLEIAEIAAATIPTIGLAYVGAGILSTAVVTGGVAAILAAAPAAFAVAGAAAVVGVLVTHADEILQSVELELDLTDNRTMSLVGPTKVPDPAAGVNRYRFVAPVVEAADIVGATLSLFSPTDLLDADVDLSVATIGGSSIAGVDVPLDGVKITGGTITLAMTGGRASGSFPWRPIGAELDTYADLVAEASRIEQENIDGEATHQALLDQVDTWKQQVLDAVAREKYRFTRMVLSAMEPGRLTWILDRLVLTGDDADEVGAVPLHRLVHTTPIGVSDDSLVLRMKDLDEAGARALVPSGFVFDAETRTDFAWTIAWPIALADRFGGDLDDLSVSDTVFLPGSGVFAEAVLGRSNAAEYVDPERYWNWQDSPIPHQAPQILPVSTAPRTTAPLPTDPTVPAATLPLVSAPDFPDPVGLTEVVRAVQNGQIFRDMSKADQLTTVLGNLAELAGNAADAAATMTGDAASDALSSATDIGKTVAALTEKAIAKVPNQAAFPPDNPTEAAAASAAAANVESAPAGVKNSTKKAWGVPEPEGDAAPLPTEPPNGLAERPWRPTIDASGTGAPGAVSNIAPQPTQIQQDSADALLEVVNHAAEHTGTLPDTDLMLPHLETWYRDSVVPLLVFARHNEEYLTSAISQYFDWLATAHQLGMVDEAVAMESLHGDGMTLIRVGLEHAIKAAFAQMEANNDLEYLVDALNWVAMAQQVGLDQDDSPYFDANGVSTESGIHVVLDGPLSPTDGVGLGDSYELTLTGGLAIGVNPPLEGHVVTVALTVDNGTATPADGPLHATLPFTSVVERTAAEAMRVEVVGRASLLNGTWNFEQSNAVTIGA